MSVAVRSMSVALSTRTGRPSVLPCLRARASPARVRSMRRARSNSVRADRMWSCKRPAAVYIQPLFETHECHAAFVQVLNGGHDVRQGAAEPVETPDVDNVHLAAALRPLAGRVPGRRSFEPLTP
jgi:hypothetical protein